MQTLGKFEKWWLDAWPHRIHVRRYIPKFLKLSPEPFRGEVLEIGAGRGWTSRRILETYPQVELTATDIDPLTTNKFDRLQQRYGQRLKARQADVLNLPFDRSSFDFVIVAHTIHHIPDAPKAIRELLRVVRPGGLIGIADEDQHYVVGPLRWLWSFSSRLGSEEVQQLLRQEGAEIVVAEGEVHYFIWARKPY